MGEYKCFHEELWYGVRTGLMQDGSVTQDDIHNDAASTVGASSNWASRGIVGRGVLIDYYSWASENEIKYDTTGSHPISLDEIKKIAQEKSITIHPGDILFLRTGKASDPALSPRIRLTVLSL
jgi:hypothetical protein